MIQLVIPETITVPEAMKILHCSKSFLYHLLREGRLKGYMIKGKRLIDAESLGRLFC
ncbi:helix-turn-helix domain-containing protein [Bifidobacterium pseudolongum]|uniref:helix-turn-helix domain-containing protein n=1 Tax=Bifidobacterium pseudolongum TaxID=1694 RepID=UPI00101F84F0